VYIIVCYDLDLGTYGDKLTNMLLVLMLSVSEKLESRKAVLIIQLSIVNNQLIKILSGTSISIIFEYTVFLSFLLVKTICNW